MLTDDAPPVAAVHARLGQILVRRGDTVAARASFEEALRLDATNRFAKEGLEALNKSGGKPKG
jgi:predicted negative regulator of RcsB-dependent stress response